MNYTYLLIDLASVIVPFIFSFHPKIHFNKEFKYFFPANAIVALLFIIWDIIFTNFKVWGFNPRYLTGYSIFNLPVEEVLFFIFIPFSCVFTYHCFKKLYFEKNTFFFESSTTPTLILLLLIVGTIYIDRLYTSVTFIVLAGSLFFLKYILKIKWLAGFYISYSILLLPFLIVNGILTGSFLEEPVVWYDNGNNMGVRIFTIPFEDIFYGMLLILFNVAFYYIIKEWALERKRNNKSI